MAYGVIIRASLATAEGTHMIEVLRRDYSGAIHEVHAGTPFYVEEYGTRGADLDADIRPSQVTVNLIITDAAALGAVRGTLSAESREYRMVVRHGAAVMWQGYVMPVTSVTQLDDGVQGVRVVAKDRVRSLDDQIFTAADGAPYTGQASLGTMLERELGYVGHSITQHEYASRFRTPGVIAPYAQIRIDQARFYDDETGEPTHSRGDVVRAILGTQQAQLTQWRGRWEVTTPHAAGDTFSVDKWVVRSDELSGEPPARQGRASYDVGGTAVALQNGSFEAGPIGGSTTAPGWTGIGRRQAAALAVDGEYVGVREAYVTMERIDPETAAPFASGYGYQRVAVAVGAGPTALSVSMAGRIYYETSEIPTEHHEMFFFAEVRHLGGHYFNDVTGRWQSAPHKIYVGRSVDVGYDFGWVNRLLMLPTVPECGRVEVRLYDGVVRVAASHADSTGETYYDAIELMPQVASGREIISFTSYSPTAQDGEPEQINVPLGDGPFGSARGAMLLESGALTSEWRGTPRSSPGPHAPSPSPHAPPNRGERRGRGPGSRAGSEGLRATKSGSVPHTQILAEHLKRTRGKGRRRVRLTTMGPVSEMAPVKKRQLDGAIYWPTYMEIEWPSGQATIEGIELIDVPVPSGMREEVEVRPRPYGGSGPVQGGGASGGLTIEEADQRYLRPTGVSTYVTGTPGEDQILLMSVATHPCAWSGRGSAGVLETPAATRTLSIRRGASQIGTVTFNAASTTGALSGNASIDAGDVITLVAPSALDESWRDLGITLLLDPA